MKKGNKLLFALAAIIIAALLAMMPLEFKRTSLIFSSNLPEWVKYLIW